VVACNYTQGRGRQSGNVQLELRDAITGNKANEKTSPGDVIDSACNPAPGPLRSFPRLRWVHLRLGAAPDCPPTGGRGCVAAYCSDGAEAAPLLLLSTAHMAPSPLSPVLLQLCALTQSRLPQRSSST
jgi:hypothetical protein